MGLRDSQGDFPVKPFAYGSWSVAMKQLKVVSAVDWVSVCQGLLEQFQGSAVVCSLVQFQEAYPLQCVELLPVSTIN